MHTEWPPSGAGPCCRWSPCRGGSKGGFEDGRGPCGSQTSKVLHSRMLEAMDGWVNGGGMLS
jgi:hypothetical protein